MSSEDWIFDMIHCNRDGTARCSLTGPCQKSLCEKRFDDCKRCCTNCGVYHKFEIGGFGAGNKSDRYHAIFETPLCFACLKNRLSGRSISGDFVLNKRAQNLYTAIAGKTLDMNAGDRCSDPALMMTLIALKDGALESGSWSWAN